MLQYVFKVVAKRRQAAQAKDGARALERMDYPLGGDQVGTIAFARGDITGKAHQIAGLIGRLGVEAFQHLAVGIRRNDQRDVLGGGQYRSQLGLVAEVCVDLTVHRTEHVGDFQGLLFIQRMRCMMQMIYQTRCRRRVRQVAQVIHNQRRPFF